MHKAEMLSVVLGEYDQNSDNNPARQAYDVEELTLHENFKKGKNKKSDDIAVLKLKNKIKFTPQVQLVCSPVSTDNYYEGKAADVAGWGNTASSWYSFNVCDHLYLASLFVYFSTFICPQST